MENVSENEKTITVLGVECQLTPGKREPESYDVWRGARGKVEVDAMRWRPSAERPRPNGPMANVAILIPRGEEDEDVEMPRLRLEINGVGETIAEAEMDAFDVVRELSTALRRLL